MTDIKSGRLGGKVAVITGAGSGIGRETALHFASEGARVVVAEINEANGRETIELATARGLSNALLFQRTDVSREDEVEAAIARAVDTFGRLDCVYNNAGFGGAVGPMVGTSVEDWDATMAVLLRGVFLGVKHAARAMIAGGQGGVILNTASVAGLLGGCGPVGYSTAKAAVDHLTRMAAVELAPHHIRVAAIAPGGILTPMTHRGQPEVGMQTLAAVQPWPRVGQPADVARAAVFLASDDAQFVSGTTLVVDGALVAQGAGITTRAPEHMPLAGLTGLDVGESGQASNLRPTGLAA